MLTTFVFAGVLLACPRAHAERVAPADEPGFIQIYKQLAVKILSGGGPTANFVGTGFAFPLEGKALALTNAHVVALGLGEKATPGGLNVAYAGSVGWHAAVSVLSMPQMDLAVIETDVTAPQARPFPLGRASLSDTVYSISFDQEEFQQAQPVVFKGAVVGIMPVLFPSSVLLTRPPIPPDAVKAYVIDGSDCIYGASGSMVLNARGELIAVNAGRIEGGLCIAVAAQEVVRLLSR
ncbi:MAG TPA: serine protease [Burkholderiales bacterium]